MHNDGLIKTKLHRPSLHPHLLPRLHLVERLENGRSRKLALISAPAGYGKSVLVSSWLAACESPAAWLSLDKHDGDLAVFLSYFIGAIETLFAGACPQTQALLTGTTLPPADYLAASLINETATIPHPFIVVLDDYHLVTSPDVQQLVAAFIQYQPEHIHLVLITRQDPMLDLVNLRAKGQITEIRTRDLQLDREEAQQLLTEALGKRATPELADQLRDKTEGWVTGLHLATLVLQEQKDTAQFLQSFGSATQYIMEYLLQEVLERQPQAVQNFLLYTAVLDRFCAPLCHALQDEAPDATPSMSGPQIIEWLVQRNIFIIPLDRQGEWFRYHHLFQDLLQYQLAIQTDAPQVAQLHLRASRWFEENGLLQEAFDHACMANDMQRVVGLIAAHRHNLMNQDQWAQLQRWLNYLPRPVIDQHIPLLLTEAWLHHRTFNLQKIKPSLQQIEVLFATNSASAAPERLILQGETAVLASALQYYAGQGQKCIDNARFALEVTPAEHLWVRNFALSAIPAGFQLVGQLDTAIFEIQRALDEQRDINNQYAHRLYFVLMLVELLSANLHGAEQAALQALTLAKAGQFHTTQGWALQTLGYIYYQWNDLEKAREYYSQVLDLRYLLFPSMVAHSSFGLAQTLQAMNEYDAARQIMDSILEWMRDNNYQALLLAGQSHLARLALMQGERPPTAHWANFLDTPLIQMLLVEIPHLTLAWTMIAEENWHEAAELLWRLRQFVEDKHNNLRLIEVLNLQTLLCAAQGQHEEAGRLLATAVSLAENGGFIRLFVDLGRPMAQLLDRLRVDDPQTQQYLTAVLAACGAPPPPTETQLSETLTYREIEILTLLTRQLSDKEIAGQLVISINTVRFHLKNIYAKLSVQNRRQAALLAQELGLVSTPED